MTVAELAALLASLPPDYPVELTLRLGSSGEAADVTRNASAERQARYRERKRNALRNGVTGGGLGVVRPPKAESLEKREEFPESTCQVRAGEGESEASRVTSRVTVEGKVESGQTSSEEPDSGRVAVLAVWEGWREETGRRAKLDQKRKRRIEARLREGFTVEELKQAIRNRRNDPFLMGRNDSGRVYDGIETLLRDAAQVERLRDLVKPMVPSVVSRPKNIADALVARARAMSGDEGPNLFLPKAAE